MTFEEAWDFIIKRSSDQDMVVVQDKTELEYIFNLMKDCKSYLEVGTAEGNSLYVLANALPKGSEVAYIDWAETHTEEKRNFILERLTDYKIIPIHGDSNDFTIHNQLLTFFPEGKKFDAVLIDAGHDEMNVAIDAFLYGQLVGKYMIFHDVQLPAVNKAYEWYCRQNPDYKNYRVVNSPSFGFGVIECTQ